MPSRRPAPRSTAKKTKSKPKTATKAPSNAVVGRGQLAAQKAMAADEERWRAESDLRVLREARQIEQDRTRLAKAKKLADVEMKALNSIKNA